MDSSDVLAVSEKEVLSLRACDKLPLSSVAASKKINVKFRSSKPIVQIDVIGRNLFWLVLHVLGDNCILFGLVVVESALDRHVRLTALQPREVIILPFLAAAFIYKAV
jgi:hypothetical protein